MDDQQIIALYWARAEQAIAETAKRYGRYCFSIAHNILQSREDSEECVNDTWLRAWNSIPPRRPDRLSTFLGKITRNLAINRWEKASAEKRGGGQIAIVLDELCECLPNQADVEQAIDDIALTDTINRFVAGLPVQTRRMFVQRYWYLRSIRDIAAEFGASQGKVKMSLLRTRAALREQLEKEGIHL